MVDANEKDTALDFIVLLQAALYRTVTSIRYRVLVRIQLLANASIVIGKAATVLVFIRLLLW